MSSARSPWERATRWRGQTPGGIARRTTSAAWSVSGISRRWTSVATMPSLARTWSIVMSSGSRRRLAGNVGSPRRLTGWRRPRSRRPGRPELAVVRRGVEVAGDDGRALDGREPVGEHAHLPRPLVGVVGVWRHGVHARHEQGASGEVEAHGDGDVHELDRDGEAGDGVAAPDPVALGPARVQLGVGQQLLEARRHAVPRRRGRELLRREEVDVVAAHRGDDLVRVGRARSACSTSSR